VTSAFRKTDAGVIPQDWESVDLAQLSAFITKGSTPTTYGFKWEAAGVLFLRSECVSERGLELNQSMFISEAAHAMLRRSEIVDGDILVTITGNVGRAVLLSGVGRGNMNQHIARVRVTSPKAVPLYIFHALSQPTVRARFIAITTGQAYPQISLQQVRHAQVALPSEKAEQDAIARALSDADALIESLERLLAKKRHLKQGAMQELLTGKKRLPGFTGTWEARNLGDLCVKIQDGTHFSPELGGNDFLYVTSKNIRPGKLDVSTADRISAVEHAKIYARCDVVKGDLLLTKDGANTGNAALNTIDEPFSLLSSVALLRFDYRRHDARYFLYQVLAHDGQQQIAEMMSGNAITRLTLTKIRLLRFPVPSLAEQSAIAEILGDMDREIDALEAKLTKARQIKQGMMQELLTGRIRLV